MRDLTRKEKRSLGALFEALNDREIRYVVLRKYEDLPDRVDGDVDVFIDADEFDRAVGIAERIGFERVHGGVTLPGLVSTALRAPRAVAQVGLSLLGDRLPLHARGHEDGRRQPIKRKLRHGTLEIDAVNRLTCPEGAETCLPPPIEAHMLSRRQRYDGFYVPSDVDALAHYVTHCLVDYEGRFPAYYRSKCETLAETVAHDAEKRAAFRELMEILYGDDAPTVTERVLSGDVDDHPDPPLVGLRDPRTVRPGPDAAR